MSQFFFFLLFTAGQTVASISIIFFELSNRISIHFSDSFSYHLLINRNRNMSPRVYFRFCFTTNKIYFLIVLIVHILSTELWRNVMLEWCRRHSILVKRNHRRFIVDKGNYGCRWILIHTCSSTRRKRFQSMCLACVKFVCVKNMWPLCHGKWQQQRNIYAQYHHDINLSNKILIISVTWWINTS